MLFLWSHQSVGGAMCKLCGTAVFRKFMDRTLYLGWWGLIAFFANFYAIFVNLINRAKLISLAPPPRPVAGAVVRPMYLRFGTYFALGLLAVVSSAVVREVTTSDAEWLDGSCVRIANDELTEVICSVPHTGKVIAVIPTEGDELCPVLTDDGFVLDSDQAHLLCLDLDQ